LPLSSSPTRRSADLPARRGVPPPQGPPPAAAPSAAPAAPPLRPARRGRRPEPRQPVPLPLRPVPSPVPPPRDATCHCPTNAAPRSEEHTSELQSREN